MRKSGVLFIILGLLTIVGIYFAVTYTFPEIEVLQFYQQIDEEIVSCEKKSDQTIEEILNELNKTVSQTIETGRTFDGSQSMDEIFNTFNEQYAVLKSYNEKVIPMMDEKIQKVNFDKIEKVASRLPENLSKLGQQLSILQQERIAALIDLNKEIKKLTEELAPFEDNFYSLKTSDAVQYFQSVATIFNEVEKNHEKYNETIKNYYAVKAEYYECIANKGVLDYILKK